MTADDKKYLVCLDSSERAPRVLAAAVDLALRTSAKLVLFRSVGLPAEITQEEMVGVLPANVIDDMLAAATQRLMRLRDEVPSELLDSVEVKLGTPWDSICHEAEKVRADLVILGSHGYRGLDRLLGTTAAKVVNHAPCSVMVVR